MKADRKTTKPISRGKSKTQEVPPTHKAVTPKPHEKKTESKQAETALHSAEENYRSIFEQAPVGIFQSTPQGRFRNVNSAMAQIYGYDSPEQMITEITSIGDQVYVNSSTRQEFQRILAERGEIHNSLDENYRKDGSRIWTQTTARAIKDKDGNVLFYEGFIIDVTERLQELQQLHESEERFRALIENASDMILTITADGNLNYVSPAALRITGYQADEVIGRNIVEFIHADDLPLALQALASRSKISGLAPDPIELRFHHKDGVWRIVEILGNNLLEYPAVKGIVLNVRDITDRKQAEAAVRESEDRYRDLVENSQDLLCTHDLNGQILSANPRAEKMLGYEHTALLQMNFRDILAPEALPGLTAYLRRITKRGADQGQMIVQTKTGERRIWEYNNTLRTEGVSTPIVRGMARDITERKRAEDALRENEKTFRSLFENMLNGFAYCQMLFEQERPSDFIYLEVNKAFETLTGLKNVVGKKVSEVIPGIRESDSELIATYGRVALTGIAETFETYVEALRMWLSISVYSPKKDYFVAVFDVITERKQAEEALHQAEIHFRALVEQTPAVIYTVDSRQPDFFVYISQQIEALSGYSPQAWIADAQLWNNLIHTEDRERVLAEEIRTNETGEPFNIEYRLIHRDGHLMWVHEEARQLHDASGQPTVWQGFMLDITERKLAEEKIRQSEKRYHSLFEQTHDAVFIMDFMGNHVSVNQRAADMLGYTLAEIQKLTFRDISAEITQSENILKRLVAGEQIPPYERLFRKKNGQSFPVEINVELVRDSNGNPKYIQSVVRDITERRQAEEEIVRRANEFAALYDTARDLAEHRDLPTLLQTIVDRAATLLAAPGGGMYLYDKTRGDLHIAVSKGTLLPIGARVQPGEGMAGRVAQTQKPLIVNNYRTWEGRSPQYEGKPIAATIEVPMIVGGELLGVLVVFEIDEVARMFTDVDARLLSLFAGQAAGAVHNARLLEETVRQLDRLEALHGIDLAISASMDLPVTLNILLKHVTTQLKMDAADVLLFNPHSQMLEYAAGCGFRGRAVERTRFRIGEGQAGLAALEQRMIQHPDFAASGIVFAQAELLAAENVAAYFVVPLIAKGKVKGVLEVFHRAIFHPESDWISFLETLAGQAAIAIESAQLFENLLRSNTDLLNAYDKTIEGWSHALDLRDEETEGHSQRVTAETLKLARASGMTEAELVHVRHGALLHDIGKMGVPDHILLKPGKLTDEEWVAMRKHPQLAYELLSPIAYLRDALDIPYCHHEKWDGTGYPRGLKGEQIPLAARLFAIVDVWDALRSDRPYRQGWPKEKVIKYIKSLSGTHFDPAVVAVFLEAMAAAPKKKKT